MKQPLILLLTLLLLSGCAGGKGSNTPNPSPVPDQPSQSNKNPNPAPSPAPEPAPSPAPTLTADPIWLLAPSQQPLWAGPVTVVVENSSQSRPQAGLHEADLVVELLSESEISRFLGFYWSTPTAKIGPVRSARTGLVAMADAYNAPFAHAGGNTDALAILQTQWGPRDLDEIYTAGGAFFRAHDRSMPHNLYTSTDLLGQAIKERRIIMEPVPTSPRSPKLPQTGEAAQRVEIDWHRLHTVSWRWQTDQYLRYEDGEPHLLADGEQIGAVNLVFLEVTGVNNGPDLGWALDLDQGGPATILVAGHRWEGGWQLEPGGFRLYPPEGGKLPVLAPGSTWAHLITQESSYAVTGQ